MIVDSKMSDGKGFLPQLIESTKEDLVVGEEWCAISMEWWKLVLETVEDGLDDAELPDVDNLPLCDSGDQTEGIADAIFRRGLKQDIDYQLVPRKTWEIIHERFAF